MKVLHISFHKGCQNDIKYICKKLNFNLTFMNYDDGISKGNEKYNVTHEKAKKSWDLYKDYYNSFDIVITSDTAPISRIFLQNNFTKMLIIWICNRFDYAHKPVCYKEGFPDKEYYDLIQDVKNRPNVKIIGYTHFELIYSNKIKKLSIGNEIIKPIGKISSVYDNYISTNLENKNKTFFIGPYRNDNIFMNLKNKVESLGIKVFNGRYNGPKDLAEFAGVIHIPYAWSNLAFFEGIQLEIPYFIPSLNFLKYLINNKFNGRKGKFIWSPPFKQNLLHVSEWYCEVFSSIFIYFDSWKDLKNKIDNFDSKKHKKLLREVGEKHEKDMLLRWIKIFK
tara:strand:- start:3707 stop:4714 length:1008 start_codon:yes stop_codon:yes gene_type:complete